MTVWEAGVVTSVIPGHPTTLCDLSNDGRFFAVCNQIFPRAFTLHIKARNPPYVILTSTKHLCEGRCVSVKWSASDNFVSVFTSTHRYMFRYVEKPFDLYLFCQPIKACTL